MMRPRLNRLSATCLVLLALLLPGQPNPGVHASTNIANVVGYFGMVGVVKDDNGNPMLAVYGADGGIIRDIGYMGVGDYVNARLMTADQYRTLQKLLATYKTDHDASRDGLAVGATLMTRDQYLSQVFRTPTGLNVITPPLLYPETASVLVIAAYKILRPNPVYANMVLMEFPADLTQNIDLENTNRRALILNAQGQVIYQSDHDISVKAEVYKDRNATDGNKRLWSPRGVPMEAWPYGGGGSNENGEFSVTAVMPPCPGFRFEYKIPITAKIPLVNFNPKNGMIMTDFAGYNHYHTCVGYGEVPLGATLMDQLARINAIGIVAALATPVNKVTFWTSTMQLAAVGSLPPRVSLGTATHYHPETGLLTSISKTDLENTDIYIYRVSNGQLVAEIKGLEQKDPATTSGSASTTYRGVHDDQIDTASFGFSSLILGANDFQTNRYLANRLAKDNIDRSPWAPSKSGYGGYRGLKPDFLRPGEQLNIIAINRATGYIGTRTTRIFGIALPATPIQLQPPNLKIFASRDFEDKQGLTKDTPDARHHYLLVPEKRNPTSPIPKRTTIRHTNTHNKKYIALTRQNRSVSAQK